MPKRLRIVITAGPTREYLDSVRFISNPSSGKMGYAIARAAAEAGHQVTLISGPVALDPPAGVRSIHVESSAEMAEATRRRFIRADAGVFAAAVCDYRPLRRVPRKLPKKKGGTSIQLVPTEDIAASCGRVKGRRVMVGFALEDHQARAHAARKLRDKNFDAIILNGPEAIGADSVGVCVLRRGGSWESWPPRTKDRLARRIVRLIERLAEAPSAASTDSRRRPAHPRRTTRKSLR